MVTQIGRCSFFLRIICHDKSNRGCGLACKRVPVNPSLEVNPRGVDPRGVVRSHEFLSTFLPSETPFLRRLPKDPRTCLKGTRGKRRLRLLSREDIAGQISSRQLRAIDRHRKIRWLESTSLEHSGLTLNTRFCYWRPVELKSGSKINRQNLVASERRKGNAHLFPKNNNKYVGVNEQWYRETQRKTRTCYGWTHVICMIQFVCLEDKVVLSIHERDKKRALPSLASTKTIHSLDSECASNPMLA